MRIHPAVPGAAFVFLILTGPACRRSESPQAGTPPGEVPTATGAPAATPTPSPDEIEAAIERIEEERESPGGVATPVQLRHYEDTRRFLALQMADAQQAGFNLPHDDAELVEMIAAGKLVRLAPMSDAYLLYEVGEDANYDPLTHYDSADDKDVPLLPSLEAVEARKAELDLQGASGRAQKAVLDTYYGDPARRDRLFREYQQIASFASKNGYDLGRTEDRERLHRDLLSYIRPQARDALLQVARAYRDRFGRLLPVTSVIRTERYQRGLTRVNANATRVGIPPHTTGGAFDISYRYMASDEQNFVMETLARLEDEQKVEALRERRGHFHVYAYAAGQRPPEDAVQSARSLVDAAREERAEERRSVSKRARASKKAKARTPVKRTAQGKRPR